MSLNIIQIAFEITRMHELTLGENAEQRNKNLVFGDYNIQRSDGEWTTKETKVESVTQKKMAILKRTKYLSI